MKVKEADMTCRHSTCGFRNKKLVRNTLLALCEHLRQRYGHTLPRSTPRLLEKFDAYKQYGYQVLVNGNSGNQSARKVGMREGRLLLKLKRSKFPVYTDMQIFEEYNRQAKIRGLNRIESPQTVNNYLYKTNIKLWWYAAA